MSTSWAWAFKFLIVPAPVLQSIANRTILRHGCENVRLGHTRFSSTQAETDITNANAKAPKPRARKKSTPATELNPHKKDASKKPLSQTTQLIKYIQSLRSLDVGLLGKTKFAKVKRETGENLCLINDEVASSIADTCQPHASDLNAIVIEFNPGLGLLTSKLKSKLGLKNVNCFEGNDVFHENLRTISPDLNIIDTNFLTFPRLHHLDKLDGGVRVQNALGSVKNNSKEDLARKDSGVNTKLYVFGATPEIDFINFTIKSLVTQKILYDEDLNAWANKDITYFLALGSRTYTIINATSELGFTVYRASSILFQLLFNYAALGYVSRKAFVPWENSQMHTRKSQAAAAAASEGADSAKARKKRVQTIPHDPEAMCIVKFSPNQQTIDKIGRNNLFTFWYFVRHHLFARSHCVIPELEQWIPGCGPRLIRKGYTIYTTFGSLTPQQILDVYLDFSSWPEFQSSSFLNAAEKYLHKVDAHEEDMLNYSKNPRF